MAEGEEWMTAFRTYYGLFKSLVITAKMLGQGIGHHLVHVDADALQFMLPSFPRRIDRGAKNLVPVGATRYAPACRGLRIGRPVSAAGSGCGVLGAGAIAGSQ